MITVRYPTKRLEKLVPMIGFRFALTSIIRHYRRVLSIAADVLSLINHSFQTVRCWYMSLTERELYMCVERQRLSGSLYYRFHASRAADTNNDCHCDLRKPTQSLLVFIFEPECSLRQ